MALRAGGRAHTQAHTWRETLFQSKWRNVLVSVRFWRQLVSVARAAAAADRTRGQPSKADGQSALSEGGQLRKGPIVAPKCTGCAARKLRILCQTGTRLAGLGMRARTPPKLAHKGPFGAREFILKFVFSSRSLNSIQCSSIHSSRSM